jgi:hypothetical protein
MKNCTIDPAETSLKPRPRDYLNKLVLACILVPTGFWAVEKVQPYVHPLKVLTQLHHYWTRATMTLREQLYAGLQGELREEVTRVENEIAEIEQEISETEAFDPQLASEQRRSLQPLKKDLERLLALKGDEVQELAQQVIADLDRKIIQTKATSSQEELRLVLRKSRIQYDSAVATARKVKNPAASVLNQWLDAIEQHDVPTAKGLMTEAAAGQLTPRKVSQLRDRLGNVESMQVTRRGGRLGFTIGEGAGHDLVFVGIHTDGDRVAIDAVEF